MDAALTPYPFCHSDLTTKDRQASERRTVALKNCEHKISWGKSSI
jgi:hypothetical protein